MRTDLGPGHSRLKPPAVVGQGVVFPPIQGYLHPLLGARQEQRKRYRSFLRRPTVTTAPQPFVAAPVAVTLAPTVLPGHRTMAGIRPPRFVGAGITFRKVQVSLAYSRRGAPKSRLRPPTVVFPPPLPRPTQVHLAYQSRGKPKSRLPRVVYPAIQYRPVQTHLAYSRRGLPKSRLPVVVVPPVTALARPVQSHLAYSVRGRTMAGVRPPRFVGAGITFRPVQVHLAPSLRGKPKSRLYAPAVVATVAAVYPGPKVTVARRRSRPVTASVLGRPIVVSVVPALGGIGIQLARTPRTHTLYRLYPPTVTSAVAVVYFGPVVTLAYSRRGQPKSLLRQTVYPAVSYRPLQTHLTYSRRGIPKSRLAAPTVVDRRVYFGPQTAFAYSRRGTAKPVLGKPTVIDLRPQTVYLSTALAYSRRGLAKPRLRPPAVIRVDRFFGPSVTLAYSRRGLPNSVLGKPTVIDLRPQVYYLTVALAPSRRGVPKPRLFPPTVVDRRVYAGPTVTLAPSVRGVPRSVLRKPAVIDTRTYYGPAVTVAYSLRGQPKPRLAPPTVVGLPPFRPLTVTLVAVRTGAEQPAHRTMAGVRPPRFVGPGVFFRPIFVHLARIVPQPTVTKLSPPAVTQAPPKAELELRVTLAYSRRGKPRSALRKPVVIDTRPQTRFLSVNLTYSRRGLATYGLAAPAEIGAPINFRPVQVSLAYSVRGKPKSVLRRPTVIDLRPQTRFLTVSLAYSRRGRPVYELKPPAVIDRTIYFGPTSTLAYSRRGRPKSILRKPVVIDLRPQAKYLSVSLAYSRRGRPLSVLRKPVLRAPEIFRPVETTLVRLDLRRRRPVYRLRAPSVVGQIVFHGPTVTLAPQKRGLAKPFLMPPAVTRPPFVAAPLVVHLAYSLRGTPRSFLRKPVLAAETFAGPSVHLAPSRFPQPMHRLAPPAVVGGGIAFFGPQTTLVRIFPPPVEALLKRPTVVSTFIPPAGDVCGTDEPAADDCGTDQAVTDDVCGTDEPAFDVSGSDSPESRIVGSDTAVGDVCGTDEQST